MYSNTKYIILHIRLGNFYVLYSIFMYTVHVLYTMINTFDIQLSIFLIFFKLISR